MSKHFGYGFVFALLLVGCASFSYDRYGIDLEAGKLLHYSDPSKDLPLDTCARDEDGSYRCVALLSDDFYRLKSDYERLVDALKECQSQ